MVNPADVKASEVDEVTRLQYLACFLLEEMNRKGYVIGSFPPRGILTSDERMLFNRMQREGVLSDIPDEQIVRAIVLVVAGLKEMGYNFTVDVSNALRGVIE